MKAKEFTDYLYGRLPNIYRSEDAKRGLPLYKFITALGTDSGVEYIISKIEGIVGLVDPQKCPDEYLPLLCECFGIEYLEDINKNYHRKLVANIGELIRRRGTYSCAHYLVKALTGLTVTLEMTSHEVSGVTRDLFAMNLLVDTVKQIAELENSINVIYNFIGQFLPFNVDYVIRATIVTPTVVSKRYYGGAVAQVYNYDLR
jgi:phage tail-like protein